MNNQTANSYNASKHQAFTVYQFCDAYSLSRTHFYSLLKSGQGPKIFKIGRKTMISIQSAADWVQRMEAEHYQQVGA